MDYTSTLPYGVLVKIFGGLTPPNPNCVRFLCAAASVCPNWREAAKEPCLWRHLRVDANQWQLIEQLTGPRLRNLVAHSHNTLTWLELERCPLVNEAALTLSLLQQPCLVYVSFQGCESISRKGLAHALCDAENFQGVVEQLNNPRQSVADAQRCCVALCTLLDSVLTDEDKDVVWFGQRLYPEEVEATLVEAQAAGTLDALLRCAVLHAAHAGVQAACCYALSRYIYGGFWIFTAVATFRPIFQAGLDALKAHPLDIYVQRAALPALRNACFYGLEGTPGVDALLDAIPLILAVMRAFPTDLDVQHAGCDTLVKMCNMNASMPVAVATAGAMGLFIKALYLDVTNESIRFAAVEGIGAIALSKAALPQASLGIDAVMRPLRDSDSIHNELITGSGKLMAATRKTLGIYLRFPSTRERAIQAGAEYAIQGIEYYEAERERETALLLELELEFSSD